MRPAGLGESRIGSVATPYPQDLEVVKRRIEGRPYAPGLICPFLELACAKQASLSDRIDGKQSFFPLS